MPQKKTYKLHRRQRTKGRPIYYVQFRLPDDKWSTAKSTKETVKGKAEAGESSYWWW